MGLEKNGLPRRDLLRFAGLGGAALFGGLAAGNGLLRPTPALARTRPTLTHGIASGEVGADGALIWARSDLPATLVVETAATESFHNPRRFVGPLLTPDSDGTGRLRVNGHEPGQTVHYRVTLEGDGGTSEPMTGSFTTAPGPGSPAGTIRFVWSGDVVGQGWGINPEFGGLTGFAAMAARNPDFFIHSGDTIYADGPLKETVTLDDGRVWKNLVTEPKSAVAQTLDQYRGNYRYNLLDEHYRAFNAAVPQFVQWDDHEVLNNWYPGQITDKPEYSERNVDVLAARAHRAFYEWQPIAGPARPDGSLYRKIAHGPALDVFMLDMRTFKDPNTGSRGAAGSIFGAAQVSWLIEELRRSTATWKVIVNDLPLGLVVPDGDGIEGIGQGDPGAPLGRETELGGLLTAIKDIPNVVWLTADVHYTAAHHYDPNRAAYQDFSPFWEFVSGPLHAGGFGPNDLDPTFGPEAVFVHAPPAPNASPLDGFQHFGEVTVDPAAGTLTVRLLDTTGTVLFTQELVAD